MAEQLPALRASRLPWHPIMEEYGVARTDWQALVEAVFPGAQSLDSIRLALSYCKRRNLDPFKKVVHIVPVWDSQQRKYLDTIWPGIAELRTTAFRTQQYAGADPTEWGDTVESAWQDANASVKIIYPSWAQLTVYRLVGGQRVPVPGPRVYWIETYSSKGQSSVPNERWRRAPFQMLEKCAEAAALRRAFPEELGDEHSHEESGAITRDVSLPEAQPTAGTWGKDALRERLGMTAPDETEDLLAAGEGPEASRASALGNEPDAAPPESVNQTLEIVPLTRIGRGKFDWPRYVNDYIAAGQRTPRELLGRWRGVNAALFDALRENDKEQWARANQALAEYEREATSESSFSD